MIRFNSLVRDMISVSYGTTYCPVWEINDVLVYFRSIHKNSLFSFLVAYLIPVLYYSPVIWFVIQISMNAATTAMIVTKMQTVLIRLGTSIVVASLATLEMDDCVRVKFLTLFPIIIFKKSVASTTNHDQIWNLVMDVLSGLGKLCHSNTKDYPELHSEDMF